MNEYLALGETFLKDADDQYLELGKRILKEGAVRSDRTGVGTIGIFGGQLKFNLQDGFPLLTTKKVFFWPMVKELLWFLEGSTDNKRLNEMGCKIWDQWATESGDLGPIYGHQWVKWQETKIISVEEWDLKRDDYKENGYEYEGIYTNTYIPGSKVIMIKKHNQIAELIHNLKHKPFSRRHVISAWNVADLPDETLSPQDNVIQGKMALAPCHCLFQFHVRSLTIEEFFKQLKFDDRMNDVRQFNLSYVKDNKISPEDKDLNDSFIKSEDYKNKLFKWADNENIPTKRLSCQLYQRKSMCAF